MSSRSPLDARSDLCIDHGARLAALERWQERQNGSLTKLVDAMHSQGERLAGMDEKLSTLIARQAEDRAAVEKLRNTHDSGPIPPAASIAKPPEQQLDAVTRVTGLPLWKLIFGALLAGAALVSGSKATDALFRWINPPSVQAVSAPTQPAPTVQPPVATAPADAGR